MLDFSKQGRGWGARPGRVPLETTRFAVTFVFQAKHPLPLVSETGWSLGKLPKKTSCTWAEDAASKYWFPNGFVVESPVEILGIPGLYIPS